MYDYIDNLTVDERTSAIKLGCAMSCADNMVDVPFEKEAGAFGTTARIMAAAALLGIPLGMVAHGVGRAMAPDNVGTRAELDRIKYYRTMADNLRKSIDAEQESKQEEDQPELEM